jgi:hypothetical protein
MMPSVTVVRPRKVEIYECDSPNCREVCDVELPDYPAEITHPVGTKKMGCGWIAIPHARRMLAWMNPPRAWYFCSWGCVADWAIVRGGASPAPAEACGGGDEMRTT